MSEKKVTYQDICDATGYFIYFGIPEHLKERYTEWRSKHQHPSGAMGGGGGLSFIFVPTFIGEIVQVKCSCGSILDLSEYESW